jgi:hypothetical protein
VNWTSASVPVPVFQAKTSIEIAALDHDVMAELTATLPDPLTTPATTAPSAFGNEPVKLTVESPVLFLVELMATLPGHVLR